MHKADITAMLAKMCSAHLLESFGRGRGTKYHVYGLKVGLPEANVGLNVGLPEANMGHQDANIALNMDTSESNIALQESNMALNMDTSGTSMALPKRYSKEQIRNKVIEVCSTWITAEEIAIRIGRDTKYVKNFVLPQMADALEKMYDIPHHPRQKYRAKQKETDA